jgi:hypothetical protein
MLRRLSLGASILASLSLSGQAFAQAGPSASPSTDSSGESNGAAPTASPTVSTGAGGTLIVQPAPSGGVSYLPGFAPAAGGRDPNADLPSSSRPQQGNDEDSFDLGPKAGPGGAVYGSKGSTGIVGPQHPLEVPAIHVVRKGDTLWDLCDSYYQNPWGWPKVWSYNPQVVNPHWIYPGDQLRLRDPNDLGKSALAASVASKGGRRGVAPSTIFLREQGFLGDPQRDVWGELVGAVEDQMMLSSGNHVYMIMRPGVTLSPGQSLTIFTPVRKPEEVPGARTPPGEIVAVKGTIKIDQFNTATRVARGEVVESLDVIERGFKVGPVGRSFDVVPPKAATRAVTSRVLSSFYPHEVLGQNQLVFLDRGSEDGLEPGSRMFVLRQGDTWRNSLTVASGMLKDRVKIDSAKRVEVETTPTNGDDRQFPTEVTAELRVLRTEKWSSLALVVETRRELSPGDIAVSLVGK